MRRCPARKLPRSNGVKRQASYGWGVIPVEAEIGGMRFTTSLFPKDGTYLLPLKLAVRKQTGITVGDTIDIHLTIAAGSRRPGSGQ